MKPIAERVGIGGDDGAGVARPVECRQQGIRGVDEAIGVGVAGVGVSVPDRGGRWHLCCSQLVPPGENRVLHENRKGTGGEVTSSQ